MHQSCSLQNRNQKHWAKNFGHGNERVCLKPKLLPPKVLLMASIVTPWLLQSQVRTISMTISITDLIASHMHITRFYLSAKEIWETVRRLVQAEAFLPKIVTSMSDLQYIGPSSYGKCSKDIKGSCGSSCGSKGAVVKTPSKRATFSIWACTSSIVSTPILLWLREISFLINHQRFCRILRQLHRQGTS